MEPLGMSLGVTEMAVLACGCLIPIVIVVGVAVVLLVVLRRGKPKAAPEKTAARKPAPVRKAEPTAATSTEPAPQPKAVTVEEIATKSCASCGADNPADNAFCEYCGAPMTEE